MTLNELPIGACARVGELHLEGAALRRMLDMGLTEGTSVRALIRSPAGDPTAYAFRGAVVAFRARDAALIELNQ